MSVMMASTEARLLSFQWEVKYELKSPDVYKEKEKVITINGQSPGPTIQAHQGDTINVKVTNELVTENMAIDWGGIRQVYGQTYRNNAMKVPGSSV